MTMRARLVISGNVQDVGYRTLIRKVANKMRVNGVARNLENGDVEVYCECLDKDILVKFCKGIEIKSSTGDLFVLNVDNILIHLEDSKEYHDPKTDFKTFQIDYGMELDPFQKATLTRSEVGVLLLGGTRSDIKAMHGDLKADLKDGFGRVEEAVKSMHTDINTRFDTLDTKYGEFGKDMKALRGDIGDLKLLASEFREFKDLFAIYVKHQLEKDRQ
jgi:acylphosphatase